MANPQNTYMPADPQTGTYVTYILGVQDTSDAWLIRYDIATGPSAGWAYIMQQRTGRWLLYQRIDKSRGGQVLAHILAAASVTKAADLTGHTIKADINITDRTMQSGHPYRNIARTYPLTAASDVTVDDIAIDCDASWAAGSPKMIRAALIARYSGLPLLLVDIREKKSPMISWCAAHRIAVLPMVYPAGDYTSPQSAIIVDRKSDISELYHDFAATANYRSYGQAAITAAAMGKQLIYVIAVDPADHVRCLDDLADWTGTIPGVGNVTGTTMHAHIRRYMATHSNTDFIFVARNQQCDHIYKIIQEGCRNEKQ